MFPNIKAGARTITYLYRISNNNPESKQTGIRRSIYVPKIHHKNRNDSS